MDSILKDIRFGARMLLKNPGMAAISIIALTLGIGLTTTMFSIVYGALYRGLPFEEPHRLMHLERNNLPEDIESMEVTIHDFVDWREQQTSFEDIAAFFARSSYLADTENRPERYTGAFISANGFRLIQAQAQLGRTFREGEDSPGAEPVILLSHALWRDRYGGDPDIVGRTVRLNGEPMTVIGVMPDRFEFPLNNDLWVPLRMNPLEIERGEGETLEVFGRLNDGVSPDQARAEFTAIAKRLEIEYPETNEGVGAVIKPYTEEFIGEEAMGLLMTMLAAVFGVLLIACANVANLLLSRAVIRSKEVAIRSAVGASRLRVVTQLLTEVLVIAAIGGALGLGIAWIGVLLFNMAIVDANPPFWIDIRVDPVAVGFVLGLVFLASLLAGIIPALKASGANVNEVLKDESRGSSSLRIGRFSKGIVVAEIALSFGLLVAAGLMTKSVILAGNVDHNFPAEEIFTARMGLVEADYPEDADKVRFYDELLERLEGRPGVEDVTLTTSFPGLGTGMRRFAVEGQSYDRDQDYPLTRWVAIAPSYFETFAVSVLEGRAFGPQDNADALQVAIANQSFARRYFSGESVVGRRVRFGTSDSEEPWLTIVGLVPDMFLGGANDDDPQGLYVPLAQNPREFVGIGIRAAGDPLSLTPMVRDEVAAIDENLPIYFIDSLEGWIRQTTWFVRVFGGLFMIFGATALFLASVGLYGVMSFSVSQRTKELGVRMAMGAQAADVLKLVIRQGLLQLVLGVVLGFGLAVLLSRAMEVVLFNVEPLDPYIFLGIVAVLSLTGLVASLVPARRATRVDPMVALRYE